jgi:hypothetical protein
MTPRQVKIDRPVKIRDPFAVARRFYSAERGGIIGAGGNIVPRELLNVPGIIGAHGCGRTRVCIAWTRVSDGHGGLVCDGFASMWLDADELTPAPSRGVKARKP